jgi:hypothetical protein
MAISKRMRVQRGTARRARRDEWRRIAVKMEKATVRDVWNEEQKRLVPTTVRIHIWQPSFAEFTKQQQR